MTDLIERTKEEIIAEFGVDPTEIGNRYRSHWIVDKIEDEEEIAGAKIGDLCVWTRDGASNPIDTDAIKEASFVGTAQSSGDCTYRCYYFRAGKSSEAADALAAQAAEIERLTKERGGLIHEVESLCDTLRAERARADALAARVAELEAALRQIEGWEPATQEVTLAHQMAEVARTALQGAAPARRRWVVSNENTPVSPEALAAAWATWHERHGGKLGPGPAFSEALAAGMAVDLAAAREAGRLEGLEEAAQHLETVRAPREPYGHAKAAVMLDAAAIRELIEAKR